MRLFGTLYHNPWRVGHSLRHSIAVVRIIVYLSAVWCLQFEHRTMILSDENYLALVVVLQVLFSCAIGHHICKKWSIKILIHRYGRRVARFLRVRQCFHLSICFDRISRG